MKAVTISEPGATPHVNTDIDTPTPGEGQILVKLSYTAINPVDAMMAQYGFSVQSWPFTPGCDASGIVVKTGPKSISALGTEWKEGDRVFGCTRVGTKGHTAWAEYFLFDAQVCFPVPPNLSLAEAAGTGVGLLTAGVGIFTHLDIPLLDTADLPASRDEWALVFGGSGSVGQFAVQLLKLAGFQVVTTSSVKSFDLLKSIGASATVDYHKSTSEIVDELKHITNSSLNYAFDAVSSNNDLLASVFAALAPTSPGPRRYTTTNSWDALPTPSNASTFIAEPIQLGPIGRPDAVALNDSLKTMIPVLYKLLETCLLRPSEYSVEGQGIESIIQAWEVQKTGKNGSTKVIVSVGSD